jgi:hypothetical protein
VGTDNFSVMDLILVEDTFGLMKFPVREKKTSVETYAAEWSAIVRQDINIIDFVSG